MSERVVPRALVVPAPGTAQGATGVQSGSLGEQVRKLRAAAGLTQHELAVRTGSSQPAIAQLEAGRRVPTLPTLEKLAQALGHDLIVVFPCATPSEDGVRA